MPDVWEARLLELQNHVKALRDEWLGPSERDISLVEVSVPQHGEGEQGLRQAASHLALPCEVRPKVSLIFAAWFRVAAEAWRERWQAAEAALAHAESKPQAAPQATALRAEEVELHILRLEAAVESQRLRASHAEQEALKSEEATAAVEAKALEALRASKEG